MDMSDLTDHPARDCKTEQWLTKRGAQWSFEERPLEDFDIQKSLKNQARLGTPLNQTVVAEYKLQFERGEVPPAVIAYHDGRSLVLIGGNHRLAMLGSAGQTTIPVYVVKAEEELLISLTFQDNVRTNGIRPTEEERKFQANYLIDRLQATIAYAAEHTGLSESTVKQEWGRYQSEMRARKVGVKGFEKLSPSAQARLGQVRTDEGFSALTQVVLAARLPTNEIGEMVSNINKFRSSREQQEYVTQQSARLAPRIQGQGGTGGGTSRKRFSEFEHLVRLINGIEKLTPREVARTARQTGTDLPNFQSRIMAAADRLLEISLAIDEEGKKRGAA